MLDKKTSRLIAHKLSGEATPEELQQLQDMLSENDNLKQLDEILSSYWGAGQIDAHHSEHSLEDAHFQYILQSADADAEEPQKQLPVRRIWIKKFSAAAAIAAVSFGIVYLFIDKKNGTPALKSISYSKNEVVARPGVRSRLILPDSSSVWLNSESRLVYNCNFNEKIREVELEGEAFFEVAKDPRRPFIVHTSNIDIKVLGTSFNVKSYPREKTIEATLIRGSIEVVKKDEPKAPKVILRCHEKLVFQKDLNTLVKSNLFIPSRRAPDVAPPGISISQLPKNIADTSVEETSWVYNKLLFDGDSFYELAVKMERWFNVKINFRNEKTGNYRFRGVFDTENIEEALQALQLTAPFKYKINKNEVLIDKK
ncbi:MAG: FecR family protein [Chitinophagaceae bacterium]|nr:FecR family protein [Chitinophagaceae bacterium]